MQCSAYLLSDPLLHVISLLILVFQVLWCDGMGILITACTRKINVVSQYLCKLAHRNVCFGESALLKSPCRNSARWVQISEIGRFMVCS